MNLFERQAFGFTQDFIFKLTDSLYICVCRATMMMSSCPAAWTTVRTKPRTSCLLREVCYLTWQSNLTFIFLLCDRHESVYFPEGPVRLRREVVLLTDDRNLRVKALTRNVPVRDIPVFLSWAKVGWTADRIYSCTHKSSSTTTVRVEGVMSEGEDEYKGENTTSLLSSRQKEQAWDIKPLYKMRISFP